MGQNTDPVILEISSEDLKIDENEVFRAVGYGENKPDSAMLGLYYEALEQSMRRMEPAAGSVRIDDCRVDADGFKADDIVFECGRVIAQQLTKCSTLHFFACTLGYVYDSWSRSLFHGDDPLQALFVDAIGSVAVESVADRLEDSILQAASSMDFSCSNRLSPGYCDWNVREQDKLFKILPPGFLGIRLSDSAMMTPIKSVSGVIGVGPGVRRMHSACGLCSHKTCHLRKSPGSHQDPNAP